MSFGVVRSKTLASLSWLRAGMTKRDDSSPGEDRLAFARRLPVLLGLGPLPVVVPEQVHRAEIAKVGARPEAGGFEAARAETALLGVCAPAAGEVKEVADADGLITALPGVVIGIFSADCVPIVLVDPDLRRIGVVHAGREGTRLGIAARAVERMRAAGSKPANLLAWIAPSISGPRYEVSEEMAREFLERFGPCHGAVNGRRLDLAEINRRELVRSGFLPERIEVDRRCTYERADLFYSYRREGAGTGRMLTFAAITG